MDEIQVRPETHKPDRRIVFLRIVWFFYLAFSIFGYITTGGRYAYSLRFNRSFESAYFYFSQWVSYFDFLGFVSVISLLLASFYLLVSIFVFARKSRDLIGVLTSISLMGVPNFMLWVSSETQPEWKLAVELLLTIFWINAFLLLLFNFPDGQFIPRGFKKIIWIFWIFVIGTWSLILLNGDLILVPLIVAGLLMVTGILSQVYRYFRVSTIPQKQQTKWVFFSLLFLVFWLLFISVNPGGSLRFEARVVYGLFLVITWFVVVLMIPIAFTVSILRYRLFDIDLIIRRTLQYGILTGLLAVIYFGLIVVLQAGVTVLTKEERSPIVTVVTTLLIAALFNPLRVRIQEFINRQFYRTSYNAEKILQEFSQSARDEVDIDRLTGSILQVVETTMQPEKAIFLIRKD